MSEQAFDADRFTETARRGWDTAANSWKKWSPTIERAGQRVNDTLVGMARIRAGDKVLDVGTGYGQPLATILERVGPHGSAVATDLSPQMIELARERVASTGIENATFHVANGESLDIPERDFDAALGRWVVMLMADPDACLRRVHALLRPGGRFAVAVFSDPSRSPFLSVAGSTVRRETGVGPPKPGEPNVFRFADAADLEQRFRAAGFDEVARETAAGECAFESAEGYIQFLQEAAQDINRLVEGESAERQSAIWQAVADAVQPYRASDGQIRLGLECHCIAGRKPK